MSRRIVSHRDAIYALDEITGWRGGWAPVYRSREGIPAARMWWHHTGIPGSGALLAGAVRGFDERYSDEIEIGLPQSRRWNGGIGGATILWARVEGADQLRRARAFRPLPSLVIQEGAGSRRWLVWALEEFLSYSALGEANRRIAYALRATQKWGGDPDAFRVHAPGSCLRVGRSRPVPVVCGRLATSSFTVAEVVGRLKAPPEQQKWWERAAK